MNMNCIIRSISFDCIGQFLDIPKRTNLTGAMQFYNLGTHLLCLLAIIVVKPRVNNKIHLTKLFVKGSIIIHDHGFCSSPVK